MFAALFSGMHDDLADAELSALIEMKRKRRVDRVLLFEADDISEGKRAALTHFVGELISEGDVESIVEAPIRVSGSFMARAVRVPHGIPIDVPPLEAALGEHILAQNEKAWVDLRKPETVVVIIVTEGGCYLIKKIYDCDRSFTGRHPLERPFFHPSSMKPELARVMVNLAKTGPKSKLLDPFCGAGGILLEGASIGALAFGVDADREMVDGARKNLAFFGLSGEIQEGLAQELSRMFKFKFDAIVTDPPYGRNSSLRGKKFEGLCSLVLAQMEEKLAKGGRIVLTAPKDISKLLEEHFETIFSYSIPVHKSLTRKLYVLEGKHA